MHLALHLQQDLIQLIRDHTAPSFICFVTLTRNHHNLSICFVMTRIGQVKSFMAI